MGEVGDGGGDKTNSTGLIAQRVEKIGVEVEVGKGRESVGDKGK